jgi:hypothetical protein
LTNFVKKSGQLQKNISRKQKNAPSTYIFNMSKCFTAKFEKKKSKMRLIFYWDLKKKKRTTGHPIQFLFQALLIHTFSKIYTARPFQNFQILANLAKKL